MDILKKLEVVEDAERLKQALEKTTTEEEFFETLKQFGLELTAEEIEELSKSVKTDDELSEENLDLVAGGNPGLVLLVAIVVISIYMLRRYQQQRR